jgi:hypothetical protein
MFPEGLTAVDMAALSGEAGSDGDPTPWAIQVRYEDRLLRTEAAGEVCRALRSGSRRGARPWILAGPGPRSVALSAVAGLGFTGTPGAAATPPRPARKARPGPAAGASRQARVPKTLTRQAPGDRHVRCGPPRKRNLCIVANTVSLSVSSAISNALTFALTGGHRRG